MVPVLFMQPSKERLFHRSLPGNLALRVFVLLISDAPWDIGQEPWCRYIHWGLASHSQSSDFCFVFSCGFVWCSPFSLARSFIHIIQTQRVSGKPPWFIWVHCNLDIGTEFSRTESETGCRDSKQTSRNSATKGQKLYHSQVRCIPEMKLMNSFTWLVLMKFSLLTYFKEKVILFHFKSSGLLVYF